MNKELREAIQYVHDNILMEDVRATIMVQGARGTNSLNETDPMNLKDSFFDLMEEYSADNDLPECWWLEEADEDDILSYVIDCDNGELEDADELSTDEMIQAMVSRAKGKSFSVYGTYQRQDDERGWFEVEYNEVEIKDDGDIVAFYDVLITDHKHHATYREHENMYFGELPMEEQIDLYEQVMEKIEDLNK